MMEALIAKRTYPSLLNTVIEASEFIDIHAALADMEDPNMRERLEAFVTGTEMLKDESISRKSSPQHWIRIAGGGSREVCRLARIVETTRGHLNPTGTPRFFCRMQAPVLRQHGGANSAPHIRDVSRARTVVF